MTSFVCKCALFGIVKIMLGRSLALLVNYLPRLRLSTARRCLIAASSVRLLSRSYGRSDSDDRRGVGHSKSNSKESPTAKLELERSFQLLGVNKHDCTVEQIRKAYIDLVKVYHPDSRTPHASAEKSAEIREAFKHCMSHIKKVAGAGESSAALEQELREIDQSLGLVGREHRIPEDIFLTQDYFQRQVAYAQERISQRKAEFRGLGKSIRMMERDSPILDDVQEKLNNMMGNAGFAPEWISLDKEIRQGIENVKKRLSTCWSKCGPHPMTPEREKEWEQELEELSQTVKTINKKITSLNLIVPTLSAQRMHVRLELLVSKVTATAPPNVKDLP